jgi:MFS family permease
VARFLGANFGRLLTASAFSNLADGVFQVALPLYALELTRSPAQVAAVTLAGRLPWLLFALPAGALADRLDRQRTMVTVDVARVGALVTLAAMAAADVATIPLLCLVAFLLGVGETLFDTAAQSVLPAIVERDDLNRANGRLLASETVMNQFVGPPIGGFLAGAAVAVAFGTSAGAYAVAAAALATMTARFRPERSGPVTRLRTDIAEGVRYLAGQRVIRTLAFMVGVMNLGGVAVMAVFPLYAVDPGPMGLSEAGFGLLLAVSALGALAGSFLADRLERTLGRSGVLVMTVTVGGASAFVPVITTAFVPVALAFAAIGLSGVAWNVVTVSLRQRIVPDRLLGRVNAGYRLLAWGSMPVGAGIGGLLGETLGLRSVFIFSGVTTAALVLCRTIVSDEAIAAAEAEGEAVPR